MTNLAERDAPLANSDDGQRSSFVSRWRHRDDECSLRLDAPRRPPRFGLLLLPIRNLADARHAVGSVREKTRLNSEHDRQLGQCRTLVGLGRQFRSLRRVAHCRRIIRRQRELALDRSRLARGRLTKDETQVQLSIAAISDVTTKANRSKSLALVGLAFAISFTLGPSIGAYFASKDLFRLAHSPVVNVPLVGSVTLNSFAVPAAITLALLAIETLYLAVCLPETKGWPRDVSSKEAEKTRDQGARKTIQQRRETLGRLEWVHFGFLFFFSGERPIYSSTR